MHAGQPHCLLKDHVIMSLSPADVSVSPAADELDGSEMVIQRKKAGSALTGVNWPTS